MTTPDRTTAAAYPRHLKGQVVADSMALRWTGLFVRRYKFPRVVDRFLVPATPEPLISCQLGGSAVFKERDLGGNWITHQLQPGTLFVTRSRTPYEVSFSSPAGEELENVQLHVSVDVFLAACRASVPGADPERIDVIDFFGRDEALAHLCFACAEMLAERVSAKSECVAHLTKLIASCLAEKYTTAAAEKADFRGGLPVRQLRKVEDYVHEHLADDITLESLAELAELSPFHFSRVFKQTTGMSPLQFVTRERITRAQQLIRETKRSLIEIGLEVGYKNPSHFAQVFRRVVGVTPTEFRSAL
ncbi:MAG: helix-turn-helix domain-containing protein [Terriglobales bacterium]